MRPFDENVRIVLESHDVQDEKLEQVLIDLFSRFEKHLLQGDFVKEVTQKQNRASHRRRQSPRIR